MTHKDDMIYRNKKGQYHRIDGPAVESPNGFKMWVINGKIHNENGPAAIYTNKTVEYWLNDKIYPNKEDWELEVLKIKLGRIKDL